MRVVLSLMLAAILAWPGAALAVGGRDFPRCIHACNLMGQVCDDRCEILCTSAFAGELDLISGCVSACHAACTDQTKECRILCKPVEEPQPGAEAP